MNVNVDINMPLLSLFISFIVFYFSSSLSFYRIQAHRYKRVCPNNIVKPFIGYICMLYSKIKERHNNRQKTESIVYYFLHKLHCYWGYFFDNKR